MEDLREGIAEGDLVRIAMVDRLDFGYEGEIVDVVSKLGG